MTHTFFNPFSEARQAALSAASCKPKAYDLQIKPNSIAAGLETELREDGAIVAVKYPSGVTVRRNTQSVVVQTPTSLWFADRWGGIHPID